jgi:hypothetical protein
VRLGSGSGSGTVGGSGYLRVCYSDGVCHCEHFDRWQVDNRCLAVWQWLFCVAVAPAVAGGSGDKQIRIRRVTAVVLSGGKLTIGAFGVIKKCE